MTEKQMIFSNDYELRFLGRELFAQHATRFECEIFIISAYNENININNEYILEFWYHFYDIITEGKGYCSGQLADILHEIYFE